MTQASALPLASPAAIGRFRIVEPLGQGGMSVVYVAYDPELERRVAIKLVKRELSRSREAAGLLQTEAQAIARVDHPNVIRVYDVGESPAGVWIAMELVEGENLKDWIRGAPRAQPRPWREVLARFLDAAAGLQAAHAEGIVHRDFKPANVLLRKNGRAVVADFGLALTREAWMRLESAGRVGVAGTFHYLAPELFRGGTAGAASDQYSFCVSLYEALNLELPFHAANPAELMEEIVEGPPPSRPGIPKWLHAVVVRGLMADPEERWPSMAALIEALESDPAVRRRKRFRIAALSSGFLAVAGLGFVAQSASVRCRGLDRDLRPVWSEPVRAELAGVFGRSGVAYAEGVWNRVARRLDGYAAGLVEGRVGACRATVSGSQSQQLLDRRMACYAERRDDLAEVVSALSRGGRESVRRAPHALEALGSLDRCRDTPALLYARVAVRSAQSEAADRALRRAAVLGETTGGEPAVAAARAAVAAAPSADHARVAEAKRQLARALLATRKFDAGEAALRDSLQAGFRSRDARPVAAAAVELAQASVKRTSAPVKEAEQWLFVARSAAAAAPARPEMMARLHSVTGEVALRNGALATAAEEYKNAVALAKTPVARLDYQMGLRRVLEQTPQAEQRALQLARATLALGEEAFGPNHPDTVLLRVGLAIELRRSDRPAEAAAVARQALDDARRIGLAEGEGAAENLLGNLAQDRGDLAEAQSHFENALAAYLRAYGRRSSLTAEVLNNLAELALRREQLAEVERLRREVLSINQVVLGPRHSFVAEDLSALGHVLLLRGKVREAAAVLTDALHLTEELYGADSTEAGIARLDLAFTMPAAVARARAAEAGWRIVEASTDESSADRGLAMSLYGELLAGVGRRAEGLRWLRNGTALLERVAGPSDDLTAEARRRLARVDRSAPIYAQAETKGVGR